MPSSLVHLSDLHFGAGRRLERRTSALVQRLVDDDVDHVVVTGDVTENGTFAQFERFARVFEPLAARGRLTVVPGNHDRLGDDIAELTMAGERVRVRRAPGLHLVLCDSTRRRPGLAIVAHGELPAPELDAIEAALASAEPGALVCVLLHHHVTHMPHESLFEALGSALGLPFADPLASGPELLRRLRGRCDLVLHGHRHRPSERWLGGPRPLGIFNAGCSPALQTARRFVHAAGRLLGAPQWLASQQPSASHAQLLTLAATTCSPL
ncbi:MAG: metallophosphoesterase [Deltaproteobacteria bacterium]|nr:metallophosphoesterase [Deltaproteobacteria bacterium]MBK8238389.1 metallophosphoesterase [Deltaproteobacteria bacterium]MBK8717216.1 metallophosphoesterase [Deltaproteobacteria bacterium]MBP7286095.1 metallophosphoesterase [Nannocystaceae bacterium]